MDGPQVVARPDVCFGRPQVKGVSAEAVAGMLVAGEDVTTVADEYDLTRADVLTAAWYLGTHGWPRWRKLWRDWAREVEPALGGWRGRPVDYDTVPDPPVPDEPATEETP